jgi:uncharacterized protein (DUF1697 family)
MNTKMVALLRGVNVGGKCPMKMAELVALVQGLGATQVVSYIQSGNMTFAAAGTPALWKKKIQEAIHSHWGYAVSVWVGSDMSWSSLVANQPFPPSYDPAFLHVSVLDTIPDPLRLASLQQVALEDNQALVVGPAVYLFCPQGYSNCKWSNGMIEKKLMCSATTRNWKTVLHLQSMLHA